MLNIISYYENAYRMVTIKKKNPENNKYWQGYREIGNFIHCS